MNNLIKDECSHSSSQIKDESFASRLIEAVGQQSARSVAAKCGMSDTVLRKYLNGESTPNVERLVAISEVLGVTVEWLATGKGYKTYEKIDLPSRYSSVREPTASYQTENSSSALITSAIANKLIEVAIEQGLFSRKNEWVIKDFIEMYNSVCNKNMPADILEVVMELKYLHIMHSHQNIEQQYESSSENRKKELRNIMRDLEEQMGQLLDDLIDHRSLIYGKSIFNK